MLFIFDPKALYHIMIKVSYKSVRSCSFSVIAQDQHIYEQVPAAVGSVKFHSVIWTWLIKIFRTNLLMFGEGLTAALGDYMDV